MKPRTLLPGKWTCFALDDNGAWSQPVFRLTRPMREDTFRRKAHAYLSHNVFALLEITEDEDAPDDSVRATLR